MTTTPILARRGRASLLCTSLVFATFACEGGGSDTETGMETETDTGTPGGLEIVGSYVDEFDSMHEITEDTWTIGDSSYAIEEFKNQADWLVAQNGEANEFNPGLWSRFDWTYDGETLYYCQSAFDAPTIDDAVEASADATDLMAGCAGFAWTNMTP